MSTHRRKSWAQRRPNDNVFMIDQGCVRRLCNVYLYADTVTADLSRFFVHERIEVVSGMSDILPRRWCAHIDTRLPTMREPEQSLTAEAKVNGQEQRREE